MNPCNIIEEKAARFNNRLDMRNKREQKESKVIPRL